MLFCVNYRGLKENKSIIKDSDSVHDCFKYSFSFSENTVYETQFYELTHAVALSALLLPNGEMWNIVNVSAFRAFYCYTIFVYFMYML